MATDPAARFGSCAEFARAVVAPVAPVARPLQAVMLLSEVERAGQRWLYVLDADQRAGYLAGGVRVRRPTRPALQAPHKDRNGPAKPTGKLAIGFVVALFVALVMFYKSCS